MAENEKGYLADEYAERYADEASRYDERVLAERKKARRMEALVAFSLLVLGTGGASGFFQHLEDARVRFGESDRSFVSFLAVVWEFVPAFFAILAGVGTTYLQVYSPRQKEAAYARSSSACNLMTSLAQTGQEVVRSVYSSPPSGDLRQEVLTSVNLLLVNMNGNVSNLLEVQERPKSD